VVVSGYLNKSFPIGRVVRTLKNEIENQFIVINSHVYTREAKRTKLEKIKIASRDLISLFKGVSNQLILRSSFIIVAPSRINPIILLMIVILGKRVSWLHMDNSYFCKSEYNFNRKTRKECVECIESPNAHRIYSCKYPKSRILYPIYRLVYWILIHRRKDTRHLTQSEQSKALLEKYLKNKGVKQAIRTVGLASSDNHVRSYKLSASSVEFIDKVRGKFNMVLTFHGSAQLSKGFFHIILISQFLNNTAFIAPFKKSDIEKEINLLDEKDEFLKIIRSSQNIIYKPCTSNTGLLDLLALSDAQLIMSTWSAPIEIAFSKTLQIPTPVITIDTSEYNTTGNYGKGIDQREDLLSLSMRGEQVDYRNLAENIRKFILKSQQDKKDISKDRVITPISENMIGYPGEEYVQKVLRAHGDQSK